MDINLSKNNCLKDISFCFINPPILDYALYDLFAVPLGTLKTINLLRFFGANVFYLDALDKGFDSSYFEPTAIKPTIKENGTGKYWKKKINPPKELAFFDREFYRFGLSFKKVIEILKCKKEFDFIVIPIVFTYHYISAKLLIRYIRENFKNSKIIISGIYPKIMPYHANSLEVDYVYTGDALGFIEFIFEIYSINKNKLSLIENYGLKFINKEDNSSFDILPAWDIVKNLNYGVIRLTLGCPYACPYCASKIVSGSYRKLDLNFSLIQLEYFKRRKIFNIAFYDDALLVDKDLFFNFLENAYKISSNFKFYLPNAIHIAKTTKEVLRKMNNFKMIRFGLESLNPDDERYGNKFKIMQLKELLNNLNEVKIPKEYISFYILVGLPGQNYEEVEDTIKVALKLGIKPRIAEFSPIPSTPLFEKAKEELKQKKINIDIEEPLFQNPSVYPYVGTDFNKENMKKLKQLIYG